jgi:hypothetical protein
MTRRMQAEIERMRLEVTLWTFLRMLNPKAKRPDQYQLDTFKLSPLWLSQPESCCFYCFGPLDRLPEKLNFENSKFD